MMAIFSTNDECGRMFICNSITCLLITEVSKGDRAGGGDRNPTLELDAGPRINVPCPTAFLN